MPSAPTPRARVSLALSRRELDHVPIDLGSTIVTTVTRADYDLLREYLGTPVDAAP